MVEGQVDKCLVVLLAADLAIDGSKLLFQWELKDQNSVVVDFFHSFEFFKQKYNSTTVKENARKVLVTSNILSHELAGVGNKHIHIRFDKKVY